MGQQPNRGPLANRRPSRKCDYLFELPNHGVFSFIIPGFSAKNLANLSALPRRAWCSWTPAIAAVFYRVNKLRKRCFLLYYLNFALRSLTFLLRKLRSKVLKNLLITTDLRLAHLPTRSPRALAALPSISPIPLARFTNNTDSRMARELETPKNVRGGIYPVARESPSGGGTRLPGSPESWHRRRVPVTP